MSYPPCPPPVDTRFGYETRAILEKLQELIDLQKSPDFGHEFNSPPWVFTRVIKNLYKGYIIASPHSITMTGSSVTTQLPLPFTHKWIELLLYHTDSSYAASTDQLDITLSRPAGGITELQYVVDNLFNRQNEVASAIKKTFGDAAPDNKQFVYEPSNYNLLLNSTNTDLVFPVLYILRLS